MPTNKPKVQTVITTKYFNKLKALAEQEERSISQMSAIMLERYLDEYEKEHGEINIEKYINVEDNHGTINM